MLEELDTTLTEKSVFIDQFFGNFSAQELLSCLNPSTALVLGVSLALLASVIRNPICLTRLALAERQQYIERCAERPHELSPSAASFRV